jgi:hypothetical protein
MAGFEAGGGTPAGAVGGRGFPVGPYRFRWEDPKGYFLLWCLATLLLLAVAAFAPPIAITIAAAILAGTLLNGTQLGK